MAAGMLVLENSERFSLRQDPRVTIGRQLKHCERRSGLQLGRFIDDVNPRDRHTSNSPEVVTVARSKRKRHSPPKAFHRSRSHHDPDVGARSTNGNVKVVKETIVPEKGDLPDGALIYTNDDLVGRKWSQGDGRGFAKIRKLCGSCAAGQRQDVLGG